MTGHYYRKLIASPCPVIAWSHQSRFERALDLVGMRSDVRLLDYGCGDGTFLSMAVPRFAEVVGTDIADDQLQDCRVRFDRVTRMAFYHTSMLKDARHDHTFGIVTCMETLEHCLDHVADQVLDDIWRLCSPEGKVVISVPIEIGPSFVPKYLIRKLAACQGLKDYSYYENYSVRGALRMMVASRWTEFARPAYGEPGSEFHSHYGFNWRRLRMRVARRFDLERTQFTPIGFLGSALASQAWFVGRPRLDRSQRW